MKVQIFGFSAEMEGLWPQRQKWEGSSPPCPAISPPLSYNPFGTHTSHKTLTPIVRYSWCARDVMAAILDELSQKNLINFYCMWNQHGLRIIVFWILRD